MNWNIDDLIAEHRGLDFLNTVDDIDKSRDRTRLHTWSETLSWLQFAEILTESEAAALDTKSGSSGETVTVFETLIDFREKAYRAFSGLAPPGADAPPGLPVALEAYMRDAIACAAPIWVGDRFSWSVGLDRAGHDLPRHRIALSLWSLLQGDDLHRLKECGRCTWLFLDKARGVGRRWCRMSACGNRAKAERFRKNHAG